MGKPVKSTLTIVAAMTAFRKTIGVTLSLVLLSAFGLTAAKASVVTLPEFQITESTGPGHSDIYTIVNNSGESGQPAEYVYGIIVSNPLALFGSDSTTEKGWAATKLFPSEFVYFTQPLDLEFSRDGRR